MNENDTISEYFMKNTPQFFWILAELHRSMQLGSSKQINRAQPNPSALQFKLYSQYGEFSLISVLPDTDPRPVVGKISPCALWVF